MIRLYFDASALAKRYSKETGTELIHERIRRLIHEKAKPLKSVSMDVYAYV